MIFWVKSIFVSSARKPWYFFSRFKAKIFFGISESKLLLLFF